MGMAKQDLSKTKQVILNPNLALKSSMIATPLGPMLAIADEKALYFLEFAEQKRLDRQIQEIKKQTKSTILPGTSAPLISIEKELSDYFKGTLKKFTTPLHTLGSPFQQQVWNELKKIPYGKTRSYAEVATKLNKPTAFRAVANANGANKIAIVIPCHRVINTGGKLGGYAGGLSRKEWLINHENNMYSADIRN